MVFYKTSDEIELIRKSSLLVGKALAEVANVIRPGLTTAELDTVAEQVIRDHGAVPSFKGYNGFPATLCVSVNEHVVHGIPGDRVIQDGDVVSVDCGAFLNGFHGDSAYSFLVGNVSEAVKQLAAVTKKGLALGIEKAVSGNRVGDISHAIQWYCETKEGYGVVRELVGHGIGRSLHEAPEVPNFGTKGRGPKLEVGMTIAIEPMINLGTRGVVQEEDGWTIRTKDGKVSMHYEHTVAIGKEKADVLSSFEAIEAAVEKNTNLYRLEQVIEY
ncbi:MAG TPA: type I methionyl aminopeptidase [Bacteroidetes bacterium]|mgnify:CR=1 FL=1|jgi:methionyl aminopeptidase|nr:MAG: methionine aminopeptidase [Sphingobacteriales bacterium BACL12 MAG-120813-bin55]HCK21318.1 type I methionyl aminopeptidase [Bacteroidota bacterium]